MGCPRCKTPLAERAIDGHRVRHCDQCDGLVIEMKVMNHVMKALVAQLVEQGGSIQEVAPCHQPDPPSGPCPTCTKPMENFRYLGKVHLDRCSPCMTLFIDGGQETEDAVRTWGLTNHRDLKNREDNMKSIEERGRRLRIVSMQNTG